MDVAIEVDLSLISTASYTDTGHTGRFKKGVYKPYSKEDTFMISNLPPVFSSKGASVSYVLSSECGIDTFGNSRICNCPDRLPNACIWMTIVPMVNPACFGFQPPNGLVPIDCGTYPVAV